MKELLIHANAPLDSGEEKLAAYLDRECGDDAILRRKVQRLIEADQQARSEEFLNEGPLGESPGVEGDLQVGSSVGNYKLLQKIGEGGFGVVYMADQLAPVKRRVALKIVKLGMDTRQVVARFEAERQALAMMDHPNIATVYDAGATESGRPFFVMELVRGVPVTEFCQERRLNLEDRLALFMEVCGAVQHAHQKGIIHRDLKPSNVMVTIQDDQAVPKVIDFGVAKATQQDLTDKTLFTRFEQFIGTPAYMSPEQTEMGGLDIDTRSDIYALGVLLYELLTGTTPFDGKTLAKAGQDEVRRLIREEEPPCPSTRLTRRQKRPLASEKAILPVETIDRELDWIVMKALEKDRVRRYDTANGLAADVRRHLSNEPVEAAAPSTGYRLGKYVRRHRSVVGTVATIAAVLVVATLVSLVLFFSEREAKQEARSAEKKANDSKALVEQQRVAGEIELAHELFEKGEEKRGLAILARVLRDDPKNRVAAMRLISAFRHRDFNGVPVVKVPHLKTSGVRADGLKMAGGDSKKRDVCQVYDVATGEPEGVTLSFKYPLHQFAHFRPNHPDQLLLTSSRVVPNVGLVEVRNWKTGEMIGKPIEFDGAIHLRRLSQDGKLVLIGGQKRGARIFNIETGEPHGDEIPLNNWISHGAFCEVKDANGDRWAAIADHSGNLKILNVDSAARGEGKVEHFKMASKVGDLCFSATRIQLVVGLDDGRVLTWSHGEGQEPQEFGSQFQSRVSGVDVNEDASLVAACSWDGTTRVWDSKSGQKVFEIRQESPLTSVTFIPGRELIGTTSVDEVVKFWELPGGKQIGGDFAHSAMPRLTAVDGGKHFLINSGGGLHRGGSAAELWDVPVSRPEGEQFKHPPLAGRDDFDFDVNRLVFSPGGEDLITMCNLTDSLRCWDLEQDKLALKRGIRRPEGAVFGPDGNSFLSYGGHGTLLFQRQSRQEDWKLKWSFYEKAGSGQQWVNTGLFSPERIDDRQLVATISPSDEAATLWDAETGELVLKLKVDGEHPLVGDFSPDARFFAVGANNGKVRLWDTGSGDLIRVWSHGDMVTKVAFSESGGTILTTSVDKTARLWALESGVGSDKVLQHSGRVLDGVFVPGSERVVTCSEDGVAKVWSVATGEAEDFSIRHQGAIRMVSVDRAGRRLATASKDGTARLWDLESGLPISEPFQHEGSVSCVSFSPDGQRLATGGGGLAARIVETPDLPAGPVPGWVLDWADAIAGIRLDEGDAAELMPSRMQRKLVQQVQAEALRGESDYHRIARWFFEDPDKRTIDAFSSKTREAWVERRLREGRDDSLEAALSISPEHPLVLFRLAQKFVNADLGDRAQHLQRARYLCRRARVIEGTSFAYQQNLTRLEKRIERELKELELAPLEGLVGEAIEGGDLVVAQTLAEKLLRERLVSMATQEMMGSLNQANPLMHWWDRLGEIAPWQTLVERESSWCYHEQIDEALPLTWKDSSFDDSSWAIGKARLGFGSDGEVTSFSEEYFTGRISFYFRKEFTLPDDWVKPSGPEDALILRLLRDDGAVVYLNGRELHRSNMPDGEILPDTVASKVVSGENEEHYFGVVLPLDLLRPGKNHLAVEVHQNQPKSSDIGFDLELSIGQDPYPALRERLAQASPADQRFLFESLEKEHYSDLSREELESWSAVQWLLGNAQDALEALDHSLARLENSYDPTFVRLLKRRQRLKSELLKRLGRHEEAEELLKEVVAIPPRDSGLPAGLLDLTAVYQESFFKATLPQPSSQDDLMEWLAETFEAGDGPAFDIRGKIQLNSGVLPAVGDSAANDFNARTTENRPMQVTIPVHNQKATRIHFLHGCRWGREEIGTEVASYVIHFDDGGSKKCPVIYGVDMIDFWIHSRPADELAGLKHLAWKQDFENQWGSGTLGLTRQTCEVPDKTITHIDFVSAGAKAAPFLVGVTLE